MSRRRCTKCERVVPLYALPKNAELKKKWLEFIYRGVPQKCKSNLWLCSLHFNDDCFLNRVQYDAGFSQRLRIRPGAVPTLLGRPGGLGSKPSRQDASTLHQSTQARFRDAGCQTDPTHTDSVATQTWDSPHMVSVQTQSSRGTPGHPLISEGTQAMVACPRVGPETMSSFQDLPQSATPIEGPGFSPSNRVCVKEEVEDPITEFKVEPLDPSSNPCDSLVKEEPDMSVGPRSSYDNAKYIVFEGCLRELFDTCPACSRGCEVQRRQIGTYVAFSQLCRHCDYSRWWQSQPVVGSTPIGNLLLSAATYLTGASFFKLAKIFKAMQLQTFKHDTFRRHTRCFLEPAIVHKWKKDQQILFQQLHQGGKVAICGGMRADSPGHSSKFGTYSLMHMESNTIIDLQLVQSNEVGSNCHMEKEGLKRSLDLLEHNGLDVDYIVTERQPQIRNYLRERKITQYHDVWLLEKGSMVKVDKILHNKRVLCDAVKLSHHNQTSSLEAFQSLIQRFAPNNVVFPFMGLLCRLYLAIMHYNENAEGKQARTYSGQAVIETDPTYNYVDALLKLVFDEVLEDPTPFFEELKSIPIPPDGSAQYEGPSKEDAVPRHSQGATGTKHAVQQDQETPGVLKRGRAADQLTCAASVMSPDPNKAYKSAF